MRKKARSGSANRVRRLLPPHRKDFMAINRSGEVPTEDEFTFDEYVEAVARDNVFIIGSLNYEPATYQFWYMYPKGQK